MLERGRGSELVKPSHFESEELTTPEAPTGQLLPQEESRTMGEPPLEPQPTIQRSEVITDDLTPPKTILPLETFTSVPGDSSDILENQSQMEAQFEAEANLTNE